MYVALGHLGASQAVAVTATAAGTAASVASAAAPLAVGTSLAPFLAPIPIVGGVIAGALAIGALLFHGANPQEYTDSSKVEAGELAVNAIINSITGESLPTSCSNPGYCGKQGINPDQHSAYPNVPSGALGNTSVDVDQAISQVQQIQAAVQSQMTLKQSLSNGFFSPNYDKLAVLESIKAARASAPAASSSGTSTGLSTSSLLLIGGGLAAALAFAV